MFGPLQFWLAEVLTVERCHEVWIVGSYIGKADVLRECREVLADDGGGTVLDVRGFDDDESEILEDPSSLRVVISRVKP